MCGLFYCLILRPRLRAGGYLGHILLMTGQPECRNASPKTQPYSNPLFEPCSPTSHWPKQVIWQNSKLRNREVHSANLRARVSLPMENITTGNWKAGTNSSIYLSAKEISSVCVSLSLSVSACLSLSLSVFGNIRNLQVLDYWISASRVPEISLSFCFAYSVIILDQLNFHQCITSGFSSAIYVPFAIYANQSQRV